MMKKKRIVLNHVKMNDYLCVEKCPINSYVIENEI